MVNGSVLLFQAGEERRIWNMVILNIRFPDVLYDRFGNRYPVPACGSRFTCGRTGTDQGGGQGITIPGTV